MGASVADFCAQNGEIRHDLEIHSGSDIFQRWKSLDSQFDHLESDLRSALPYHKSPVDTHTYPRWYHDIAVKPDGPINVYSYQCESAATIWNTARMARMTLLSATLNSKLLRRTACATTFDGEQDDHFNETALAAHIVELTEDLCASIFYYLSRKHEGAGEISSFKDVAGAKAYALISPLAVAAECLRRLPDRARPVGRVEWIANVLQVMRDRLGISESWCWRDGDEVSAWIEIERTLRFDRHSHQDDESQS
jgi:hypothetical protein